MNNPEVDGDPFGNFDTIFVGFVIVFLIVFVLVVAFIIVSALRNRAALKAGGLDPLAAQSQLAVQLSNSALLAPEGTLEQRLVELDDLRERGVISEQEHREARARALGGT